MRPGRCSARRSSGAFPTPPGFGINAGVNATDLALDIFLLPIPAVAAIIALCCLGSVLAVWAVVFRVLHLGPERTPHPPLYASITVFFALFLSFTASDAWRRNDASYAALLREVAEAAGLMQVLDSVAALPDQAPAAEALRGSLRTYLDTSLKEEWGGHNVVSSEAAGAALERMRAGALAGMVQAGPVSTVWRVAMDRIDGVQQSRTARLVAGGLYGDALRWAGLYALFLAGAVAMALIHLDLRQAALSAMVLYAIVAAIALSVVAASEHPYAGWDATEPDRLVALRARL